MQTTQEARTNADNRGVLSNAQSSGKVKGRIQGTRGHKQIQYRGHGQCRRQTVDRQGKGLSGVNRQCRSCRQYRRHRQIWENSGE